MTRTTLRSTAIATLAALAAIAAIIAVDLTPPASAQSDDETTGRIVARLLDDGRVEFGWQPSGGARILPTQRYFPTDATVDRWLRSSPVEVDGGEIGRINARLLEDGRIEFAFTPTDRERILTDARYFPTSARPNRWLRSTEITIGAPSPFIAVSVAGDYTCAIRESGAIECWGNNYYEQTDAPEGSYTAVSASRLNACAIRDTGELTCWGQFINEQSDPFGVWTKWIGGQGSFTAVAVTSPGQRGGLSVCAIAETFTEVNAAADTGEIECFGNNYSGRTAAPDGRFRVISLAEYGGCAIRDTGELACWGNLASIRCAADWRRVQKRR